MSEEFLKNTEKFNDISGLFTEFFLIYNDESHEKSAKSLEHFFAQQTNLTFKYAPNSIPHISFFN